MKNNIKSLNLTDKLITEKIFLKNLNNKSKLTPFNTEKLHVGVTKFFPADSKEWKNKVYFFNQNFIKNFSIFDKNIYKLIKSYFIFI